MRDAELVRAQTLQRPVELDLNLSAFGQLPFRLNPLNFRQSWPSGSCSDGSTGSGCDDSNHLDHDSMVQRHSDGSEGGHDA